MCALFFHKLDLLLLIFRCCYIERLLYLLKHQCELFSRIEVRQVCRLWVCKKHSSVIIACPHTSHQNSSHRSSLGKTHAEVYSVASVITCQYLQPLSASAVLILPVNIEHVQKISCHQQPCVYVSIEPNRAFKHLIDLLQLLYCKYQICILTPAGSLSQAIGYHHRAQMLLERKSTWWVSKFQHEMVRLSSVPDLRLKDQRV